MQLTPRGRNKKTKVNPLISVSNRYAFLFGKTNRNSGGVRGFTLWFAFLFFLILSIIVSITLAHAEEIDDLIPAIIICESGGNPNAISSAGCRGLMQISEIVFKEFQANRSPLPKDTILLSEWTFDNMFNPYSNKEVGTWYLKRLRDKYIPKDKYSIDLLLACYNAGPTRMRKLNWNIKKAPKETRNYVEKVMRLYNDK